MKKERRDFLKGLVSIPLLGYFGFAFRDNIPKVVSPKGVDYLEKLQLTKLESPDMKLLPPTGKNSKSLRFGLVGNGWRGEQLLYALGYAHPDVINLNTVNGVYSKKIQAFLKQENFNIEFAGICDTFDVRTQRGVEISNNIIRPGADQVKSNQIK